MPTTQPSYQPTSQPSNKPSKSPSKQPSKSPSQQPSHAPSIQPTNQPLQNPSCQWSYKPSRYPTVQPSKQPFIIPTSQPSCQPTRQPSNKPSKSPFQTAFFFTFKATVSCTFNTAYCKILLFNEPVNPQYIQQFNLQISHLMYRLVNHHQNQLSVLRIQHNNLLLNPQSNLIVLQQFNHQDNH